jgi:hypothetical protein
MGLRFVPANLRAKYTIDERDHACAILKGDFPKEFDDLMDCLDAFSLRKSYILEQGGGRSPVPFVIDGFLSGINKRSSVAKTSAKRKTVHEHKVFQPIGPVDGRGWAIKNFHIEIKVDDREIPIPTHKIDNFKNRVGVEVEWNNKTEFYDRDLNNFRLLKQLGVLSVGVIITRCSELQELFEELGKGDSYGASTTHWDKLIPKIDGGGAGGCPLLLIGMGQNCYDSKH